MKIYETVKNWLETDLAYSEFHKSTVNIKVKLPAHNIFKLVHIYVVYFK